MIHLVISYYKLQDLVCPIKKIINIKMSNNIDSYTFSLF